MKKYFVALFIISIVCFICGFLRQTPLEILIFSIVMNLAFLFGIIVSIVKGKITSPQGWKADIKETPVKFWLAMLIPLSGYVLFLVFMFFYDR